MYRTLCHLVCTRSYYSKPPVKYKYQSHLVRRWYFSFWINFFIQILLQKFKCVGSFSQLIFYIRIVSVFCNLGKHVVDIIHYLHGNRKFYHVLLYLQLPFQCVNKLLYTPDSASKYQRICLFLKRF